MNQQQKKETQFLSPRAILKGRWQIVEKIGNGGFGEIYKAKDLETNKMVAVKVESCISNKQVLKIEALILKRLQGLPHTCTLYGCGRTDRVNFITMTLLGQNLSDLRKKQSKQVFSLSTVLRLGVQSIMAVQEMHDCGFLHRDIKPSNFAMGLGDESRKCFLIDFGLARQYTTLTGELKQPRPIAGFRGTVRYASINAHLGNELGRHDDLWSVFYMLIELATGTLPWRRIREKEEAGKAKQECDHSNLIKDLPEEFKLFMDHLKSLSYHNKPDYQYLINLFQVAQQRLGISISDPYDWESDFALPSVTSASGISPPIVSPEHQITPEAINSLKKDLERSLGEKVKKICKVFQSMNSPKTTRASSSAPAEKNSNNSNSPPVIITSVKTKQQHITNSPENMLYQQHQNNNKNMNFNNNNCSNDSGGGAPDDVNMQIDQQTRSAECAVDQDINDNKLPLPQPSLLVSELLPEEQLLQHHVIPIGGGTSLYEGAVHAPVAPVGYNEQQPERAFLSLHSDSVGGDKPFYSTAVDKPIVVLNAGFLMEEDDEDEGHVNRHDDASYSTNNCSSEDPHEPHVKKFERIDSPPSVQKTRIVEAGSSDRNNLASTLDAPVEKTDFLTCSLNQIVVPPRPPIKPPRSGYFCSSARKRKFVRIGKRMLTNKSRED